MMRTEGKTAREWSGGYADGLPCKKRPLSKGLSAEVTTAVLSTAEIRFPQNCEQHHITRLIYSKAQRTELTRVWLTKASKMEGE